MSRISNSRYVLAVQNLEISTRYYTDVLGFTKDPIDAPGWSFLSRDTVRLMLGECSDTQSAAETQDHSWFAYWNVEGIDDLYQEFQSKGALLTSAPTNKPWGLREFGLTTPDGHRVVCGQTL
jgi:predicted enzyme related to lactoylglutathione lyase